MKISHNSSYKQRSRETDAKSVFLTYSSILQVNFGVFLNSQDSSLTFWKPCKPDRVAGIMSRWMGALKANGLRGLNQVSEREYGRARLYMFGCFI
ncbi:hypothetical protein HanIR_Chr01g0008071 [Helianthus annuus]|nr:hypothetical protein HanIR_Chr01g0008071 [Helianthus annuus]